MYDRFGDFDGFVLRTESGEERPFRGCEREVESLGARTGPSCGSSGSRYGTATPEWPSSIVLLRAPRDNKR